MSNSNDYNKGYQDGYWFGNDDAYRRGYEEGKQSERDRIKRALDGNSSTNESSALWSMFGGSIILTIFGWCFVGLLLFLFWIGGSSGSWWFPWIWRIAFWGGVGFIIIMTVAGIVMTIVEEYGAKNPPKDSTDAPKMPWHAEYPPKDKFKAYPVSDLNAPWREEDLPEDTINSQEE